MPFHARRIGLPYEILLILIVICWHTGCVFEVDKGTGIQRAEGLIRSGKPHEAVALLSQMIDENAKQQELYAIRGSAYYEAGDFKKAVQDFTCAIELDPGCANFYYARCRAYERRNDLQKAYDDITRAIEIDPYQSEFYFKRGWIALSRNPAGGDSIEDYSKAMRLNPDQTLRCLRARGMAYEFSGEYDLALKDYMEVERLGQADLELYFTMAGLSRYSRNELQERAYLEKALARFAEDEKAGRTKTSDYLEIGQYFQIDQEDIPKALECYHMGLKRYPEDPLLHILTAKAYAAQGDKTKALAHIEKAKAIHISAVGFIQGIIDDSDWDSIRDTDDFKALLDQE